MKMLPEEPWWAWSYPAAHQVRSSCAAVKGNGLVAAKRDRQEYAGFVVFQDK